MPTSKVTRAVRKSALPPPARLVMMVLADLADYETSVIPESRTPSLTDLAGDTGLSRSTVASALNRLEADGWALRSRPAVGDAWANKARTQYRLAIPVTSPALGLVQEVQRDADRDTATSPGGGLVQEADQSTSPGAGLIDALFDARLVREPDSKEPTKINPKIKNTGDESPDFVEFWKTYPRRTAKGEARKAWQKAIAKAEPADINAAAARFAADPHRAPKFTPHPATWLNQERWGDDPLPAGPGGEAPRNGTRPASTIPSGRLDATPENWGL